MVFEGVEYQCTFHGYHVYKSVWEPKESEVLWFTHDVNNIFTLCLQ